MTQHPATTRVDADALLDFCRGVLDRLGVPDEHARVTADALVTTDTWGVFTHGTKLLPGYVRRLKAGGIRTDRVPEVVAEGPAWAVVDGHSALGQVTAVAAMRAAIGKARGV